MIHVATVHWQTDRWIDIQLRYLAEHLREPYRVYAFLTNVPGDHADKFFYVSTEHVQDHATKLDLLADVIHFAASDPRDVVMFIDGDAFPVTSIDTVRVRLERHRLVAVQRYENFGDQQPHPCFCVTTIGFWKELGGDWHPGHTWRDLEGDPVTDVGGNLLGSLESAGLDWYPLRRVNKVDLHPVFFGIYGDDARVPVVYHHGAGFRLGLPRADFVQGLLHEARSPFRTRVMNRFPRDGLLGSVHRRLHPVRRAKLELVEQVESRSEELISRMERDADFWRAFV